jgi:predicted nucleic acid-binding protein
MARSIIVDTSAIFALINPVDEFHTSASDTYTDLLDSGYRLCITSYILVEVSALVHRRLGFGPLRSFVQSIENVWEILWIDRLSHEEAWKRMIDRDGSQLSFVDWSTIVIAGNTRSSIFAFDQDFRREGLLVIPSPST